METSSEKPVIYACSGCSDAGELADRIARRLTQEGAGQMSCLAGVGGRVKHLLAVAERASRILVIDGCPINCARQTLELAGGAAVRTSRLAGTGSAQGRLPVTEENIARGVEAARQKLAGIPTG